MTSNIAAEKLRPNVVLKVRHLVSSSARRQALFDSGKTVPSVKFTEFQFRPGDVPAEVMDKVPLNDAGGLCVIDLAPSYPALSDECYVRLHGPGLQKRRRPRQIECGVYMTVTELCEVLRTHIVSGVQRPRVDPVVVCHDDEPLQEPVASVSSMYGVVINGIHGEPIQLDDVFDNPEDASALARNIADVNCCSARVVDLRLGCTIAIYG